MYIVFPSGLSLHFRASEFLTTLVRRESDIFTQMQTLILGQNSQFFRFTFSFVAEQQTTEII
jgi:hypothetical protein